MGEANFTRTRQSIAGQLREALDAMQAAGQIAAWESRYGDPHRKAYTISERLTPSVDAVAELTPGEAIEFVNRHGYDVRFGKA